MKDIKYELDLSHEECIGGLIIWLNWVSGDDRKKYIDLIDFWVKQYYGCSIVDEWHDYVKIRWLNWFAARGLRRLLFQASDMENFRNWHTKKHPSFCPI